MAGHEAIQDVNIELGDDVSRMLYEASKLTHENRPGLLEEFHESFSGARAMRGSALKDPDHVLFNLGFDGVGTKVEISERLDDHSLVAHDLFAMVCDDAVVRGAEPIAIGSILDVRHLNDTDHTRRAVRQLAAGYVSAAKSAGVVIVNGEVAELGNRIDGYKLLDGYGPSSRLLARLGIWHPGKDRDFNYNWGAAALWFAHEDRLLTGEQIQPGDTLIGLAEHGFRSNGITDVRRAMHEGFGKRWHEQVVEEMGELLWGDTVALVFDLERHSMGRR